MPAHEIDYRLIGEEMQAVEIELDPLETTIAEPGSFMMMESGIRMETLLGDGSRENESFLGKVWNAGKRALTGEGLFMTAYSNEDSVKRKVYFASPYPGKIIPINLKDFGGKIICQKDAFLCAAKGVSVSLEFRKKIGLGLFGGEGFIMQKLEGDGLAFLHAGGSIIEKELQSGEVLKVDTGCLVGFETNVNYDIEFIGGLRNTFFGGEGVFFAKLKGPGKVFIQSLPFSRLADKIVSSAPKMGGKSKGEGSILGGIGNLFDGDNR
jgi:uncharacterized protein (TIGR00266 family)